MLYFIQQLINGITLGAMYGLIAIGYSMVYGIIGMINFAHGEIYMIGAFVAVIVFTLLGMMGITWVPAVVLIMLVTAMGAALGGAGIPTHLAMWLIVPEQTKASWAGGAVKPWRKLTTGVDLGRAAVRKRAVPVERR